VRIRKKINQQGKPGDFEGNVESPIGGHCGMYKTCKRLKHFIKWGALNEMWKSTYRNARNVKRTK
jgi:hypothetical protein